MTTVTGLVDAVNFLSLGHVFTANMTGNIVLLPFASTGVPQVSLVRSITALLGFLAGAAVGGRITAGASLVVQRRRQSSLNEPASAADAALSRFSGAAHVEV